MIWGIHYFITKLKTKTDVIPRAPLILQTSDSDVYEDGPSAERVEISYLKEKGTATAL